MASLFSNMSKNGTPVFAVKRSRADRKTIARAEKCLADKAFGEAFSLFSTLAPQGDPQAQWEVGKAYLSGEAVPYSLAEAAYWINLAAQQGFPPACLSLAHLYFKGIPSSWDLSKASQLETEKVLAQARPDYEKAKFWAEKAALAGDANAQAFLGTLLRKQAETVAKAGKQPDGESSEKWLKRAAAGGSALGKLELGRQILEKEGCFYRQAEQSENAVPQKLSENVRKGISYLKQAFSEGAMGAALLLGWLYLYGAEEFRNLEKALSCLEKAAEKGLVQAQYRLGLLYLHGMRGMAPDTAKGEHYLKQALKGKFGAAGYALGQFYEKGGAGQVPEWKLALRFYHEAALADHLLAMRRLAGLLMEGVPAAGLDPDLRKGAFWLSRASKLGDPEAQAEFGTLLLQGFVAVPEEKEAWRKGLQDEAEKGRHEAAYNLALSYLDGVGGERDDRLARHWFEKTADHFPEAAYHYGKMLFEGRGGEREIKKAAYFFAKAAQAGRVEACLALAQMLLLVEEMKDHPRALKIYHQAAAAGSADAMFSLGAMYGGGHEVPMNRFKARHWFVMGAEKGNPLAQYMAGRYYLRGLGGEKDLKKAHFWLHKAVENGVGQAQAAMEELKKELFLSKLKIS